MYVNFRAYLGQHHFMTQRVYRVQVTLLDRVCINECLNDWVGHSCEYESILHFDLYMPWSYVDVDRISRCDILIACKSWYSIEYA
jgi:hypothetical protein